MNKPLSHTTLLTAILVGCLSSPAWSDETTLKESIETTGQKPAWQVPPGPGTPVQNWQQPPQWHMPQPGFGQFAPRYQPGGQYRPFPAAPVTARPNPLNAELQQVQEQLATKSSELEAAHSTIEQLRIKLQESLAAETRLSDQIAYNSREEQALRIRVTELNQTLNTSHATQEQQHQQLTAERDQLLGKLASLDTQLAALQSRLQAATQVLGQARSSTGMANESPNTARIQIEALRDALGRLEAELERKETGQQSGRQIPPEE
ncbi:MAG: hypothetical protein OEV12_04490 [Gammaproteobacteria bacterium]|nr:hypothetical protein [Gammaproteobacteria bacterium]